jgi:ketosteroid isomerase-like protein
MAEHPNIQRLREGYDAFARGDLDALRERFAPDIVWHIGGNSPLAGDYKGHDEVFGYFMKLAEMTGGTLKLEIHDLLANDTHAVALTRGSAQREGKSLDMNQVHVFHVNDEGKITEFWGFPEDQAAADAFLS